ncbi:MAG: GTP-binding protein [Promethearchaeota archaeon]|nr:MAG: GTP-binding protein [Candidatus Lokiarchaeota archaeon]
MESKVFLFGLNNAGKKSLTDLIKKTVPSESDSSLTERINKMILRDIQFISWDLSEIDDFKEVWKQNSEEIKALIFVLDVSESNIFFKAKKKFYDVIHELDTNTSPLIFCFHKMDLPTAESNYVKARDLFELQTITKRKVYRLQTSINNPKEIAFLRNQLVEIIESSRWG